MAGASRRCRHQVTGPRLRASFWRDLVADPGPLAPLGEPELHVLASLLAVLGTGHEPGTAGAGRGPAAATAPGRPPTARG